MIVALPKMWLRYGLVVVKLIFVPFALGLLVIKLFDEPRLRLLEPISSLLFAGLLVNQIALSFFALRMQTLLGTFGIKISWLQSLRIHLQSMFYFFALPMTVGLEAARFIKIKAIVGEQLQAAALGSALLADRLIGALAALVLATVLFPFMDFQLMAEWDIRAALAVLAGSVGLALLLSLHKRTRFYFRELIRLIESARWGLGVSMMVSICTHLLFAFGIYLSVIGVNIHITFMQTLFVVSAAMLFVIFPVSFAGVSPVEAASVGVLLALGVPMENAAVFVLISYIAKLIAAFEGGAWEILDGGEHLLQRLSAKGRER